MLTLKISNNSNKYIKQLKASNKKLFEIIIDVLSIIFQLPQIDKHIIRYLFKIASEL